MRYEVTLGRIWIILCTLSVLIMMLLIPPHLMFSFNFYGMAIHAKNPFLFGIHKPTEVKPKNTKLSAYPPPHIENLGCTSLGGRDLSFAFMIVMHNVHTYIAI